MSNTDLSVLPRAWRVAVAGQWNRRPLDDSEWRDTIGAESSVVLVAVARGESSVDHANPIHGYVVICVNPCR